MTTEEARQRTVKDARFRSGGWQRIMAPALGQTGSKGQAMTSKWTGLENLVEKHDWEQDPYTFFDMPTCPHWFEWADIRKSSLALASPDDMPGKLKRSPRAGLNLLRSSGLPIACIDLATDIPSIKAKWTRRLGVACLINAADGHFAQLLAANDHDTDSASQLIYTFEAVNKLEDWMQEIRYDHNYVYRPGIENWIQRYLEIVNRHSSQEALRKVSARAQVFMCPTEVLSEHADSDLLTEPRAMAIQVAAPNLPADWINEHLAKQDPLSLELVWHPKADPEIGWSYLESLLKDECGADEVARHLASFNNLRDDGWGQIMDYNVKGPNMPLFRLRLREWCDRHPEDYETLEDYL